MMHSFLAFFFFVKKNSTLAPACAHRESTVVNIQPHLLHFSVSAYVFNFNDQPCFLWNPWPGVCRTSGHLSSMDLKHVFSEHKSLSVKYSKERSAVKAREPRDHGVGGWHVRFKAGSRGRLPPPLRKSGPVQGN